ncbi:MAG: hypothetical protein GY869_07835 [Planctomycetes bacterium]|nr:hypothetical protein [Planctomycetota bacterium]
MSKFMCLSLLLVGVIALMALGGCGAGMPSKPLEGLSYQPEQIEIVEITQQEILSNWVEAPQQAVTGRSFREKNVRVVLRREVEGIALDGTIVMKVTIEEVEIVDEREAGDNKNWYRYVSNTTGTESSVDGEPQLSGTVYRVAMDTNTTIKQIVGLDQVWNRLGVEKDAAGGYRLLLDEDFIRTCHERGFVQAGAREGQTIKRLAPVRNELVATKVKAWEKAYRLDKLMAAPQEEFFKVSMRGDPVTVLPTGWAEPKTVALPWMQMSELKEALITGESIFDQKNMRVLQDTESMKFQLELSEEKIGAEQNTGQKMITTVNVNQKFMIK